MKVTMSAVLVVCLILLVFCKTTVPEPEIISPPEAGFKPKVVPANSKLVEHSKYFEKNIYEVTEGVYVAVGSARANPVLIEGTDGLIVVDPAESETAAKIVKAAYNRKLDNIFSRKPVKAIIYTHYRDCHIHGTEVFAGDDQPEIIAHENFPKTSSAPREPYTV